MSTESITTITAVGALLLSLMTVVFNAIQVARFRVELREQTDMQIYDFAFAWDRFLVEHSDCYELLTNPSPGDELTPTERALAEYRLDLAELTWRKHQSRIYNAERDFFDRLVGIPLIQKAITSGASDRSVKAEFLEQLKAAIDSRVDREQAPGAQMTQADSPV
jgi:hypothetical protein